MHGHRPLRLLSLASVWKTNSYPGSYCCGEACGTRASDDVFVNLKKRDALPNEIRPVDEAFPEGNIERDEHLPTARDVTAPKRAAPLALLKERQDDDKCRFEGDKQVTERLMGEQLRISRLETCPPSSSANCVIEWSFTYSEMVGESFGTGASAGFNLFEIMSASVEFTETFEESEETSMTSSGKYEVEPGFDGYIVWEPLLQCATGKLLGNCAQEYTTDIKDEACFVVLRGGAPDGRYGAIRQN